jgi:CelD/BcsL family acetyltransferase involved in cellulose biosynthesis
VTEGLRAAEVVGEGRVEEGGGVRGSKVPRRSTRAYQAAVRVHIDTQSSGFCSDEAHFALQTGVECRAAEAELVLVRLRWRTHEGEVVLGLPMSLEKEKAKEFAVHACGGACDGGQERDAVLVSV